MNQIQSAIDFAIEAHGDQKRKYTGAPYVSHCLEVATILKMFNHSEELQIAGLLHDTIEDTDANIFDIAEKFGYNVARIVLELTEGEYEGNRKQRKEFECQRLAKISPDAQTVKYADLISNAESIVRYAPKFATVYLAEKREILKVTRSGCPALLSVADNYANGENV